MPSLRPGTGIVLLDDEHHTDEDGDADGARVPADAAAVLASVGLLSRTDAGSGVLIREYVCILVAPLSMIILLFPLSNKRRTSNRVLGSPRSRADLALGQLVLVRAQHKTELRHCAALAPAIRACMHTSSLTYQLGRAAVLVGRIMRQFTIAGPYRSGQENCHGNRASAGTHTICRKIGVQERGLK